MVKRSAVPAIALILLKIASARPVTSFDVAALLLSFAIFRSASRRSIDSTVIPCARYLVNIFLLSHVDLSLLRSVLRLFMRILQKKNLDLVIFYLVGSHLDDQLRALLPNSTLVAFDDAKGLSPKEVAARLGFGKVRSLVLIGFSAGVGCVRSALVGDVFPIHERVGFILIDGTHASLPAQV